MGGSVVGAELGIGEMGVDLGGREGRVPQKFFHDVDRGAIVEHGRCKCVAQRVRAFLRSGSACKLLVYNII